MSTRNRFVLMVALSAVAVLMGCSSTNKAAPPPTGGFSNTNLSGTYVFSTSGSDAGGNFLTMVGMFTACGCAGGTISAGVVDMNDPDTPIFTTGPVVQLAITGGSYSVGVDGRGKASLTAATPFGSSIELDFVLSSSAGGLVTEFDNNGSGSGTLDLQSSVTQADLTGTYVFNLAGISAVGISGAVPEATVGSVTLTSSGGATGIEDINNGAAYSFAAISSPSAVLAGTSTAPGTATIGGLNFDVYAISPSHLKFIETDSFPILEGDVFSQTTSFPLGELAFTMVGLDLTVAGGPLPLAVGGMMNSNGTAISAGVEDFNDSGTSNITSTSTTPIAFMGGITSSGGRFFVSLNSFENGADGVPGTFQFAAYPSTGGTQLLEVDGLGITGGVAYPQTSTSFPTGQGYGLNLTASNISSGFEEDDIAEFTNSNNALTGLIDVNDEGATNPPQNFKGTYTADSTNAGRALITSSEFNLTSYTLDGTNTIFIEIDSGQIGTGSIGQQASESQGAIATRLAVLRPRSTPRGASGKRKQAADDRSR